MLLVLSEDHKEHLALLPRVDAAGSVKSLNWNDEGPSQNVGHWLGRLMLHLVTVGCKR